jgi:hypothetical protein
MQQWPVKGYSLLSVHFSIQYDSRKCQNIVAGHESDLYIIWLKKTELVWSWTTLCGQCFYKSRHTSNDAGLQFYSVEKALCMSTPTHSTNTDNKIAVCLPPDQCHSQNSGIARGSMQTPSLVGALATTSWQSCFLWLCLQQLSHWADVCQGTWVISPLVFLPSIHTASPSFASLHMHSCCEDLCLLLHLGQVLTAHVNGIVSVCKRAWHALVWMHSVMRH